MPNHFPRKTLLSMENLGKVSRVQDSSPLMFANPAYHIKTQSSGIEKSFGDRARGKVLFWHQITKSMITRNYVDFFYRYVS